MKRTIYIIIAITGLISLNSCKKGNNKADAYGNFEAIETTISAEANGKLLQFNVTEGQELKKGTSVGLIDTIPLFLKKQQLAASRTTVFSKSKTAQTQVAVLQAKLKSARRNKTRIENLIRDNAGTQKQLDDINDQLAVIKQQIVAAKAQKRPILSGNNTINAQVALLNDQIKKAQIINPINGTVLTKYAEESEITGFGRPLYKIADLSSLDFKGYVSETQLPAIKIGSTVTVKVDAADGEKSYEGKVTWIASQAEFTPKIIQTKAERVNLVYAIKVRVKNDGSLKIGMPAEMWLKSGELKSEK